MREIVLKRDVLQMIQDERFKLREVKSSGEISEDEYFCIDEYLFRIYHKVQRMGLDRGKK